jgi:hypothetical protein
MANPEHLKILGKGVKAWNEWRRKSPGVKPDLSGIPLRGADLDEADFGETNLSAADLSNARVVAADLIESNLCNARLIATNFISTDLAGSNLTSADLTAARFLSVRLAGADFQNSRMGATVFADVDLSEVRGLESVLHTSSSTIGIDTLYMSQGKIPEKFLRAAGVPSDVIEQLLPLIRIGSPIQWQSCFISYSIKDEEFAKRLYSRMQQTGLTVFFAPEDMKGGDYFFEQIERAIQLHDRLLLVLSEDSIQSKWVEREIRKARKVERAEKRRKLFPIRLVDMKTLRAWECLDSDTGEDLAEEVRKYHIPDFSNWKNDDAFERAFARLEKDLRTSIGK